MKRSQIDPGHREILAEYGLRGIPAESCAHMIFSPGEVITELGSAITQLYFVVKGRAKAFRLADNGKYLIVCQYISKGIIGEIELLTDKKVATTTVTAISPFSCLAIPYHTCRIALRENIHFSNMVGRILAEKLADSADHYVSSALCTGEQRLCAYILQNADEKRFCDNLTEVAASVGISYRHMFRILHALCDRKILQRDPTGFLIVDRAALTRSSQQDRL